MAHHQLCIIIIINCLTFILLVKSVKNSACLDKTIYGRPFIIFIDPLMELCSRLSKIEFRQIMFETSQLYCF